MTFTSKRSRLNGISERGAGDTLSVAILEDPAQPAEYRRIFWPATRPAEQTQEPLDESGN
jgi:hypothetical protein